jgi:two-component system, NtrC family, response regulator AtoC
MTTVDLGAHNGSGSARRALRLEEPMARLVEEMALWRSARMREIRHMIEQAARVDVTVLIQGETGTGKEVVARAVHHLSTRRQHPFIKVNCAAVPTELLESELFGHERGAFTGAHQLKIGTFEAANRGTVFLDEIGDLYPPLQAKLLHVLQDGAFSRVGGRATIRTDVRILAATNQDLERAVAGGRFREDLYYRLNVIQIDVPPLRERTEEILPLVDYFVRRYARMFNRDGFALAPSALDRLVTHRYRGNVRELENLIQRSIVLNDPLLLRVPIADTAGPAPAAIAAAQPAGAPGDTASLKDIARRAARAAEREAISRVLTETGWNRMRAAKLLRISYRALLYKLKEIDLQPRRAS